MSDDLHSEAIWPDSDEPLSFSRRTLRDILGSVVRDWGLDPQTAEDVARDASTAVAHLYLRRTTAWPERPRIPGPAEPEPLPSDALPRAIRAQVESVAEALQVPPDLTVCMALASLSAALAGKIEVNVRPGWWEPVGVYTAAILPPGTRKSPAHRAMTASLREWESERVREQAARVLAAEDVVEVEQKRLAGTKTDAARGKATPEEVEAARYRLAAAEERLPHDGRLLAGDITPEAIVLRMARQGGRLAILEPEAGPLQLVAGRYSEAPRLDELKKAWSGEALLVDRVGRSPVHVPKPALTLGLCLQPGVLESLQNRDAFRTEGILGRILWCQPPHGLGGRLTGRDVPPPDPRAEVAFAGTLRALLDIEVDTDPNGSPRPYLVELTPDAVEVLHGMEAEVEEQLGDGGLYAGIRDWGGKMVGQAVRVATLLEMADRTDSANCANTSGGVREERGGDSANCANISRDLRESRVRVSGRWMEAGRRILTAFSTHALVVLGSSGDTTTELLSYLLRKARDLPEGSTLRDLWERCKGRVAFESVTDLDPYLEDLISRGCLRLVSVPKQGPGRPPSPRVELHPSLRKSIRTIRTTPPQGEDSQSSTPLMYSHNSHNDDGDPYALEERLAIQEEGELQEPDDDLNPTRRAA